MLDAIHHPYFNKPISIDKRYNSLTITILKLPPIYVLFWSNNNYLQLEIFLQLDEE